MDFVYLNGKVIPREEAKISPFDRGFLYGYGLFETMRSYGGRIFRLDQHLARLRRSAEKLALAPAIESYDLRKAVYMTLEANGLLDARIRLSVSAGPGERKISPPADGITVLVVAEKMAPSPQAYEKGVRVVTVDIRRNSQSPLSQVKATGFLDSLVAYSRAVALGADEAILLNEKGFVAEGAMSNIFLVSRGILITPSEDSGILSGITREVVLELAHNLGIAAMEKESPLSDLLQADEAFLTSAVREVMPIASIDGQPVGQNVPGPITRRLMAAYRRLVEMELGRK